MNDFQDTYGIQEDQDAPADVLRYYFISKGKTDIIKVIQYQYVERIKGSYLFNLGFGDYDSETGTILDGEISSSNDHYKVLHTVLSTIPQLFIIYGNVILMVQGSDSKPEFAEKCRITCTRRCANAPCKRANRRINIYRGFIDKNLEILNQTYYIYGNNSINKRIPTELYRKGKPYKTILIMTKKCKFAL